MSINNVLLLAKPSSVKMKKALIILVLATILAPSAPSQTSALKWLSWKDIQGGQTGFCTRKTTIQYPVWEIITTPYARSILKESSFIWPLLLVVRTAKTRLLIVLTTKTIVLIFGFDGSNVRNFRSFETHFLLGETSEQCLLKTLAEAAATFMWQFLLSKHWSA